MRPTDRPWTYKDLNTLRAEFPVRRTAEVAAMLKRTPTAVSVKANLLGLRKVRRPGTDWTPRKLMLIRNFFPTMFNKPLAKWLGVSMRTLIRKARELGLEKAPGFLETRRADIGQLISDGLRRSTVDMPTRFRKGERNNPAGEFRKGHVESEETKAKRSAAIKAAWKVRRRREELKKNGIKL